LDPGVFRQLQDADWEGIGKRLVAFAIWRAQMYWGNVTSDTVLPKGKGIEDIVHDVVLKTLHGQRRWNPERGPLEPWLRDQIKSELDALAKSWAAQHEVPVPMDDKGKELWDLATGTGLHADKNQSSDTTDPEELAVEKEQAEMEEAVAGELVTAVYKAAEEDPELVEIIDAVQDGAGLKPRHLAEKLGAPVDEIYNRVRRLRRRAIAARRDMRNG